MITVYGADWCEDTRRSLRHLRRLGVPHHYVNIDEDLDALERARRSAMAERRTPIIDLGLGGAALVEPDNDTLTGALVEREMLSHEEATSAWRSRTSATSSAWCGRSPGPRSCWRAAWRRGRSMAAAVLAGVIAAARA